MVNSLTTIRAEGEQPVTDKPPVKAVVPEKGKAPNEIKRPSKNDSPSSTFSTTKNLSTLGGASMANPQQAEWGKSSLSFEGGCTDSSCTSVSAQVCNVGDGDMTGTVDWELYYIFDGNPKDGDVLTTGTLGPLGQGECQTLSYNPNNVAGNYMFRAEARTRPPRKGRVVEFRLRRRFLRNT